MSSGAASEAVHNTDALHVFDGSVLVDVAVEGAPWVLGIAVDDLEAQRRGTGGAVVDRRLLHALWELPGGVDVPAYGIDEDDLDVLRRFGDGHVSSVGDCLRREFRPACTVTHSVGVARRGVDAIRRACAAPPIYTRVAVARRITQGDIDLAILKGVGLIAADGSSADVLVEARARVIGSPAVYRWWIAELAYDAWCHAQAAQRSS